MQLLDTEVAGIAAAVDPVFTVVVIPNVMEKVFSIFAVGLGLGLVFLERLHDLLILGIVYLAIAVAGQKDQQDSRGDQDLILPLPDLLEVGPPFACFSWLNGLNLLSWLA